MAFQHKPGTGTIFKNERKQAANHPDRVGQIMTPDGKLWDVAGWMKEGKKGPFLSLSVKEPRQNPEHDEPARRSTDIDPEVPF
jgi:hypothetical protein